MISQFTGWVDAFFDEQIKYRQLRPQVILSIVAGVIFSLDIGAFYFVVSGTGARPVYGGVIFMLMILYVSIPFVIWVMVSILTFVAARLLGARADFGLLFRSTGWGVALLIPAGLSLSISRFLSIRHLDPCEDTARILCDQSVIRSLEFQVQDIYITLARANSDPTFLAGFALMAGFFLLAGYFWITAVEKTSLLTRAGATLVVGIQLLLILGAFSVATFG